MTTSSNIVWTKEVLREQCRMICGIPHSFKYQRMEAANFTVFHEDTVLAQIAQNMINFMTTKNGTGCAYVISPDDTLLIWFSVASSSPTKNLSKMLRQAAGTGGSASVLTRPHMSLQGV